MGSRTHSIVRSLQQATLLQIEERLAPALDAGVLQKPLDKDHSRERVFSLTRTFWSWIWQVLQANTSCREVVRQTQALFATWSSLQVDEGTSAYCQARKKLADSILEAAFQAAARSADKEAVGAPRRLQGRSLKMVDGSTVRLADTPENRQAFPPSQHQFEKPSFPMLKLVTLFSASSGAIVGRVTGTFAQSELRLLFSLRQPLLSQDIVIGDRFYGSFVVAAWALQHGADLIARLGKSRRIDFRKSLRRLGRNDAIFRWPKPDKPSPVLSAEEWALLPEQIEVRVLRMRVKRPGFRTAPDTLTRYNGVTSIVTSRRISP